MGSKSQRKGARGEQELAAVLRQYGYEIRRGGSLSFGEVPDLVGLLGVHIEVKRVERLERSRKPCTRPRGTVSASGMVRLLCSIAAAVSRGL